MIRYIQRLYQNPFLFIAFFLTWIVVLGFSLNILLLQKPSTSGELLKDYHIKQGYTTTNWSPHLFDYLELYFPSHVLMLPLYDDFQNIKGVLFTGPGRVVINQPELEEPKTASIVRAFVPMDRPTFELLLLDMEGAEVDVPDSLKEDGHAFLQNRNQFFYSLYLFGYTRVYPPTEEQRMIMLQEVGSANPLNYYETADVRLVNGKVIELQFKHPLLTDKYPSSQITNWVTVMMLILFAMSFSLTSILTLDSYQRRTWEMVVREVDHPPLLYLLGIMGLFLISQWLLTAEPLQYEYIYGVSLGLVALIILPYSTSRYGLAYLSIQSEHMPKDIFAAVILSVLLQIVSTQALPGGMNLFKLESLIQFLLIFIFVIFPQEIFWRGLFQNTIERYSHPWISLVITTIVMTLFYSLPGLGEVQLFANELQGFMVTPATYLLVGYFYQQTRNIFATTLFATLLKVLSMWLIFT